VNNSEKKRKGGGKARQQRRRKNIKEEKKKAMEGSSVVRRRKKQGRMGSFGDKTRRKKEMRVKKVKKRGVNRSIKNVVARNLEGEKSVNRSERNNTKNCN